MILPDSSIWIDHLRHPDAELVHRLQAGRVLSHPFVIGELACGRIKAQGRFLDQLRLLPAARVVKHDEVLALVDIRGLAGRGIGWVDVHLLGSTLLEAPAALWTRDKRLAAAAAELGCLHRADA